jgi:hypothetical protein
MSKNSFRLAVGVAFLALLLATPKPALADCGMGYQMGGNCYPNPSGNNYSGAQGGSNCYAFSGGSMCYVNPGSSNSYPSVNPPATGGYGSYINPNGYQNNNNYGRNGYGSNYNPNNGNYGSNGTYLVRWGDTMRRIADRFGIPLFALMAANRQIWNPNLIFPGQVIYLPSGYGQNNYSMQPQNNYYVQGHNDYRMQGQNYGQYGHNQYGYHWR